MNTRLKILHATKWAGSVTFITGMIILFYGLTSGLMPVVGIGIGTVTGAVMVFLIGMFFIATEEMVEGMEKGTEVSSAKARSKFYVVKGYKKGSI
ncbi:hypothetical protein ACFO3D_17855 [Virgibacillus kekensis]|uniref:Uncharacterized protein n=1 Tax=Virgibacillus kekensis TaxID=202261 RepID=A0ABV9DQF8_9BACI